MAIYAISVTALMGLNVYVQDQPAPTTPPTAPAPSTSPVEPVQRSKDVTVARAKMIRQVPPIYPKSAKKARIQGTVVLHAIIGKDGSVQDIQYASGPQELLGATIDAVRQWRYEPTLVAGRPVEIKTTISVAFRLNGKGTE